MGKSKRASRTRSIKDNQTGSTQKTHCAQRSKKSAIFMLKAIATVQMEDVGHFITGVTF